MTSQTPSALLRTIIARTAMLAVLAAVAAWALWGGETALGVLCGAALGAFNFWLIGRSLRSLLAQPHAHQTGSKRAVPAALLLKWPLLLGLLGLVLLGLPVTPAGVVAGIVLSLAAGAGSARPG